MQIVLSKALPVGARRKRKTGWWLKDKPGHWKLLEHHVKKQLEKVGVHPNHQHARMMHEAARSLVREFGGRRAFSDGMADAHLTEKYDRAQFGRFGLWKKHTISAVNNYLREMGKVYAGGHGQSKAAQNIEQWQALLKENTLSFKTQVEMDRWVVEQFAARKKKIAHILYAARQFIGAETPLSMIPDTGFRSLCKAIVVKFYEHGPSGVSQDQLKIWDKAFRTAFGNARATKRDHIVPLAKALSQANSQKDWRESPRWFIYCCQRLAMHNDGYVNLAAVSQYMVNAKRKHRTKNPPSPTYDKMDDTVMAQVRLGLIQPGDAKKQSDRMRLMEAEYKRKRRLNKTLTWAGRASAPSDSSSEIAKVDSEKSAKMRRRWDRLMERRPDLREKYEGKK